MKEPLEKEREGFCKKRKLEDLANEAPCITVRPEAPVAQQDRAQDS